MQMNDYESDDILGDLDFDRPRSFTWSHPQRVAAALGGKWAGTNGYEPNGMIREQSDECLFDRSDEDRSVPIQQQHTIQNGNGKKRRKSYTEIIATAILSSAEKRLTLAEIYDWMASNVDEYKNQRYVPSSSSWKNAVRHNLSVQSCFKRVKRHGVEKPSWWTVDMRQAAKRRLSIQPIIAAGNNLKNGHHEHEQRSPPQSQKRSPQPPLETVDEEGHMGTTMKGNDWCINGHFEADGESGEHGYSMNVQLTNGHGNVTSKQEFESMLIKNVQPAFNLVKKQPTSDEMHPNQMSADQLTQAWINRFKVPGSTPNANKDNGSSVQMLRVKTVHGVEQNVRFMGPLRVNVVLRCDRSCQTDDLEMNNNEFDTKMQTNTEVINSGFSFEPSFSRACSIDDHTLVNLTSESIFDVSKMMHGDVKMPSTMNVLSPSVFEDDGLINCWNSFNTDDMLNFPSAS